MARASPFQWNGIEWSEAIVLLKFPSSGCSKWLYEIGENGLHSTIQLYSGHMFSNEDGGILPVHVWWSQ